MKNQKTLVLNTVRKYAPVLTAALVLPLCVCAAFIFSPELGAMLERTALFSVMCNMPEGSIVMLKSRFEENIDEKYYDSKEADIAPYMSPWPTQSTASSIPESLPNSGESKENEKSSSPTELIKPSPTKDDVPEIPKEFIGKIIQENLASASTNLISYGKGKLRNYTELSDSEISAIMEKGMNIQLEDTKEPQVLIFHTHATESYEAFDCENYDTRNTWRNTDNTQNMVAVGNALEKKLREAGIGVVHDTTQHDYPSYNGAYDRSAKTIRSYLEKYPTIKIVLDVHRDAILREDDVTVKPVIDVDGKKAAQLMIITGSEDGSMNVPKWRENLRFAASLQNQIEKDYPQLTRPIFFCYRKYNMDLTTGSLLFEVGSNANTLEESIYTAELIGNSLVKLLKQT